MIILDTHVLVWWVDGDTKKLSRKARQALEQHGKRKELLVASISIFEITTLERRGRLSFRISASEWLTQVRRLPEYRIEPLTDDIAPSGPAGRS
jgi:PIN domain nuclease of toxin-antitoxin system